jgi:hypothetical protein
MVRMGPMPARLGRPPLFRRRVKLEVFLEAGELRAIKRAARQADVSASAWVRSVALAALNDSIGRTSG